MIEARQLTKRYGDKTAVEDLSFTVRPGVVTGFLGPNAAPTGSNGRAHLPQWSSRSYASIVRANLLTSFKLIPVGFGALTFVLRRLVRRSSSECHGKRCRNGSRVRAG